MKGIIDPACALRLEEALGALSEQTEELAERARRDEKLRRLKQRIREGTYRPDIRDVAHHLVSMLEPTIL